MKNSIGDTGREPLLMPLAQAAAHLGVSLHTLRRWRARGYLIAHRMPSGRWAVPIREVHRLAEGRQVTPSRRR